MSPAPRPPFRADHVGSLLRPRKLLDAREKAHAGALRPDALQVLEDEAIRDVVRLQEDVGLQAITDGDFRRGHWFLDFICGLDGVAIEGGLPVKFHNAQGDIEFSPPRPVIRDKLRHARGIATADFAFLSAQTKRTAKQCIPSPSILHFRGGRAGVDRDVYPDMEQFFADLADAYAAELAELQRLGCRYVQIDDTNLAFLCDPALRNRTVQIGEDPDELPHTYARLINRAIRGVRPEMTVCVHLCRGNHESSWIADGGYEPVAEALFNELEVDGYFLEYDSPRAGGFEPLRFVPKGKKVVLGLVTTKTPQLESPDELKRRIDQAAKFMPLENLCLSPQCGFASTVLGNKVTADDQRAKLALVVDVARQVWGTA